MMLSEPDFWSALRQVISAFDRLGIAYAIGGSFASGFHGEARATRDVDLIAAVTGKQAESLVAALGDDFYADTAQITAAAINQASFSAIHRPTLVKVDVFVVWRTEFGRTQLARRRQRQAGGPDAMQVFVTSPEDIILAKLDWYRKGGGTSDRQWRDVLGVLKVQAERLDRAYLREWAARLNVSDLLRRALDDAGLPPDSSLQR
jgi:hypothetical protein